MSNGTSTLRAVSPFDVAHTAIWYRSQMPFLLFCFSSFPAITLILSSIQQCVNLPQPRISCCSVFFGWVFFFCQWDQLFHCNIMEIYRHWKCLAVGYFSNLAFSWGGCRAQKCHSKIWTQWGENVETRSVIDRCCVCEYSFKNIYIYILETCNFFQRYLFLATHHTNAVQ